MKKNSKQRLFEMMERINPEFNKDNSNNTYIPSDDDIEIARKTSITRKYDKNLNTGGRSISEAVVPKFAINIANKDDLILDFGAGKHPYYVLYYRDRGYNIYGWDLPQSMDFWNEEYDEEIKPINGLNNQFDLVYASNVLNVAPNEEFLRRLTLSNIKKALKPSGTFVGNLPTSPRKNPELTPNILYKILLEYFIDVNYEKNKKIFICNKLK